MTSPDAVRPYDALTAEQQVEREVAAILNRHSLENVSNTPDFILSQAMVTCLAAVTVAIRKRDEWYGIAPTPGNARRAASPASPAGPTRQATDEEWTRFYGGFVSPLSDELWHRICNMAQDRACQLEGSNPTHRLAAPSEPTTVPTREAISEMISEDILAGCFHTATQRAMYALYDERERLAAKVADLKQQVRDLATQREALSADRTALRATVARLTGPVTKVDQRPNGCTMACVATLTGISLDDLPQLPTEADDEWWDANRHQINNAMQALLIARGWFMVHLWKRAPAGFAIAGGTSPRGIPHSVVVLNGDLWHDPHESRSGLIGEVEGYDILVPLARRAEHGGDATP